MPAADWFLIFDRVWQNILNIADITPATDRMKMCVADYASAIAQTSVLVLGAQHLTGDARGLLQAGLELGALEDAPGGLGVEGEVTLDEQLHEGSCGVEGAGV